MDLSFLVCLIFVCIFVIDNFADLYFVFCTLMLQYAYTHSVKITDH